MWASGIEALRARADVVTMGPSARGLRRRPDVWLTVADEGPIGAREPVVALVHGAAWTIEQDFWAHVPRTFAEPVIALVEGSLRAASIAIAPSEYTRRCVAATGVIDREHIVAVPHGVDLATFRPDRDGGADLVASALGSDRPYILFASTPTAPQKNLGALREAVAVLADRGLPHALVIAGGPAGGESPEELRRVDEELPGHPGRVAWLGATDDHALASLMAGAAACCLPSRFEAFGMTALEALACGAPVVVSARGALPEVVGDAGVVCEPEPADLARALEPVLTDAEHAARLRRAARARAERFPWAATAEGWLTALRHAAAGR